MLTVDGENDTEQLARTSGVKISKSDVAEDKVDPPDVNVYENDKLCLLEGFLTVAIDSYIYEFWKVALVNVTKTCKPLTVHI